MFRHQFENIRKPRFLLALLAAAGFSLAYSQASFAVPSVSFNSPTNGEQLLRNTDLSVLVTATDTDGDIAEVDLFINGDLLRTERFAPYRWGDSDRRMDSGLENLDPGTYELTAVATNDAGETTAETISVVVIGVSLPDEENPRPNVTFTSPLNGATLSSSGLSVEVDASDNGSIASVSLSLNGSAVRTERRSPYQWNDDVLQNLSVGSHTLTAVATDNLGAQSTVSVTIEVEGDDPVPVPPTPVVPDDGEDLLSFHYDNAPDEDDTHALVAGRVLADTFGMRAIAINGTYGNGRRSQFNTESERVFDIAWPNGLDAFNDRDGSIDAAADLWSDVISNGGTVYVAEGGPSDFTVEVLREMPAGQRSSVTVVQHSDWNERNTDDQWGEAWEAAFDFLNPANRLDFSDTVEALHILDVPLSRVRDWNDFGDEFF